MATEHEDVQLAAMTAASKSRRVRFSRNELLILLGLARGATYQAIASEIGFAPATVAYHANRLQQRLRVGNNTALVALAILVGLVMPGQWPPELSGLTEFDLPA